MKRLKTPTNTLNRKNKRAVRRLAAGALVAAAVVPIACATGGDPIETVNNLSDFIFTLIKAIGLILLGLGIMQVGMSLKNHDPSQRANGFLTLAGGVVIYFVKEILTLITSA